MAKELDEDSIYLTPNIICGEANEWDNLNKNTTN